MPKTPQVPMSPFPQRVINDPIAQRLTMHSVYNSLRNATARTTAPMMGTGDVPYLSDPDQQEKINSLLAPFGARLPEPDEIKQNFILPEAGTDNFFGAHPNLTRGIEGALLSAANAPGGATVGDSISNVARSVLGIPAMRQAHINQQMLAPFAQAGQVAALQSMQDTHDLRQAQTEDAQAQANMRKNPAKKIARVIKDENGNLFNQMNDGSAEPVIGPDGKQMVGPTGAGKKDLANSTDVMRALFTPEDPNHALAVKMHNQTQKDAEAQRAVGPTIITNSRESMAANKYFEKAEDADNRLSIMQQNAAHPTPQGDISLVFNHIGMTMGAQSGARMSEAEIKRAITARSAPENLLTMYQRVTNGQLLTPDQRKNMVELAVEMRNRQWIKAKNMSQLYGSNSTPPQDPTLPPLGGGVNPMAPPANSKDPLGIR